MSNDQTLKELVRLQTQADKIRFNLTRLVKSRALTTEQSAAADTRLENLHEDLDSIIGQFYGDDGTDDNYSDSHGYYHPHLDGENVPDETDFSQ